MLFAENAGIADGVACIAVNGHRAFVIGVGCWFSRRFMPLLMVSKMAVFFCVEMQPMAMGSFETALKYGGGSKIKDYLSLPQLLFPVRHYARSEFTSGPGNSGKCFPAVETFFM